MDADIDDVARRAGGGYATADRVLNGRGGGAEKSATRGREAIAALRYVRNVAAANLAQRRAYRFAAIIASGSNAFFARMRTTLRDASAALRQDRVDPQVLGVAAFDPRVLAARLAALGQAGVAGVALVGSDNTRVAAAMAGLRTEAWRW